MQMQKCGSELFDNAKDTEIAHFIFAVTFLVNNYHNVT